MIKVDGQDFHLVQRATSLHLLEVDQDTSRGAALCGTKAPLEGWNVRGKEALKPGADLCFVCARSACAGFQQL